MRLTETFAVQPQRQKLPPVTSPPRTLARSLVAIGIVACGGAGSPTLDRCAATTSGLRGLEPTCWIDAGAPIDADAPMDAGGASPQDGTSGALSLCVRRESDLPIDEAGGLAPKPLPRGLYWIQIDDAPRVEVRPDTGTAVPGLDPTHPHRVSLFRKDRRVASTTVRLDAKRLCVGLSNYAGSLSLYDWDAKRCGCPP